DDAEAAAAAALERPEQIGMTLRVDDAHGAVCGDDFGFEQAGGGGAEALGKAAEAPALDQSGDADRSAAAALHIAAAARGDGGIGVAPHGTGAEADGRQRIGAPAAGGN